MLRSNGAKELQAIEAERHVLLRIRKKLGLNQQDFADQVGVSKSTVGNYERGRTSIPLKVMRKAEELERHFASGPEAAEHETTPLGRVAEGATRQS
ncbi:MAG: helix-turn-helix transcriptional regulator [Mangrovicoccus sp.]